MTIRDSVIDGGRYGVNTSQSGNSAFCMTNTTISNTRESGVYLQRVGTGEVLMQGNRISSCGTYPIDIYLYGLRELKKTPNIADNQYHDNGTADAIYLRGTLHNNLTLNVDTYALGGCTVEKESTLTIPAGTRLLLLKDQELQVNGTLEMQGSAEAPVVITHFGDEVYAKDITRIKEAYGGYITVSEDGTLRAQHAYIQNLGGDYYARKSAMEGITVEGTAEFLDCQLRANGIGNGRYTVYNRRQIFVEKNANLLVERCSFLGDNQDAIYTGNETGTVTIRDSVIDGGRYGVYTSQSGTSAFCLTNTTISNTQKSGVYLCDIGTGDLQIQGNSISSCGTYPIDIDLSALCIWDAPLKIVDNQYHDNGTADAIYLSGVLRNNLTVNDETYVLGRCIVENGSTWTIPAGTRLLLLKDQELQVNGTLEIQGSAEAPVVLTHFGDEAYAQDITRIKEAYGGYITVSEGGTLRAQHAYIQNLGGDYYARNSAMEGIAVEGTAEFLDCQLRANGIGNGRYTVYNRRQIFVEKNANLLVERCSFLGDNQDAIYTGNEIGTVTIRDSVIDGGRYGVYTSQSGTSAFCLTNTTISNTQKSGVYLCDIGTGDLQIQGNSISSCATYPIDINLSGLCVWDAPLKIVDNQYHDNGTADAIYLSGVLRNNLTVNDETYALGRCIVENGSTWTIPAGTRLLLLKDQELQVNGTLEIQGSAEAPVVITHFGDEVYAKDITRIKEAYGGYITVSEDGTLRAQHAYIQNLGGDYYARNSAMEGITVEGTAEFLDCQLRANGIGNGRYTVYNRRQIFVEKNANLLVERCSFLGDNQDAIYTGNEIGTVTIRDSVIDGGRYGVYTSQSGTSAFCLTNTTISNTQKSGVYLCGLGTGDLQIQGNSISSCGTYPLDIDLSGLCVWDAPLKIVDNQYHDNGTADAIYLNGTLKNDLTLNRDNYALGECTIINGSTLTIPAGALLLSVKSKQLRVNGTLEMQGSAEVPVVLTHFGDEVYAKDITRIKEAYGGYITVSEGGTLRAQYTHIQNLGGNYYGYNHAMEGIIVEGTTEFLDCQLRANGIGEGYYSIYDRRQISALKNANLLVERCSFSGDNQDAIYAGNETGTVTIRDSVIDGGRYGVYASQSGTSAFCLTNTTISDTQKSSVYLYGLGIGDLQIQGNSISSCGTYPIDINLSGLCVWDAPLKIEDNQYHDNGTADAIYLSGTIKNDLTLNRDNYALGECTVINGSTLTIPAGALLLSVKNKQLQVNGTLEMQGSAEAPIVLTHFGDEVYAQDITRTKETYGGYITVSEGGTLRAQYAYIQNLGGNYYSYNHAMEGIIVEGTAEFLDCQLRANGIGEGYYSIYDRRQISGQKKANLLVERCSFSGDNQDAIYAGNETGTVTIRDSVIDGGRYGVFASQSGTSCYSPRFLS